MSATRWTPTHCHAEDDDAVGHPYLVTRLDMTTWTMHVFPLLSMRDIIHLNTTGNGLLMDRLASTRVESHVPVEEVACLPTPLRSIRSVPLCIRAVALNIGNMPSEETQELLRSTLPNRPAIVRVDLQANRYSLPRVLGIIGCLSGLEELRLDVAHLMRGVPQSEVPSLDVGVTAVKDIKRLTIQSPYINAITERDVQCLHELKSLHSLHGVDECASPICNQISGFRALQSLRLDHLNLCKPFRFVVDALPQTLTSLRLQFSYFHNDQWIHGTLPSNLTRLSIKKTLFYVWGWNDNNTAVTTCPKSITRLSVFNPLLPLFEFGRNPSAIGALNQLEYISLHGMSASPAIPALLKNLPSACQKLKLFPVPMTGVDWATVAHVRCLSLTLHSWLIDLFSTPISSDESRAESIFIYIRYDNFCDIDLDYICKGLKETTADVHIVWDSFITPKMRQVLALHTAFLSSRQWFTFTDIGHKPVVFHRGRLLTYEKAITDA